MKVNLSAYSLNFRLNNLQDRFNIRIGMIASTLVLFTLMIIIYGFYMSLVITSFMLIALFVIEILEKNKYLKSQEKKVINEFIPDEIDNPAEIDYNSNGLKYELIEQNDDISIIDIREDDQFVNDSIEDYKRLIN